MAKGVVWMGFGCALTVLGWSFGGRWLCMGGVMYVRGVRRWVVIMGRRVASQGGRPTAGRLLNKAPGMPPWMCRGAGCVRSRRSSARQLTRCALCCAGSSPLQGQVVRCTQTLMRWLGMGRNLHQLAYANTLGEQKKVGRVCVCVETIGVGAREVHAFGVNVAVCGAGAGG